MVAPQSELAQPTVQTLSPSVVFTRVREEGELVSASQDYSIVDKVTNSNRDFLDLFDVPFTEKSFWYRYNGTIKAGVDLATAELEQDESDPSLLHVTLDQPHIISNTPDMDKSGVLEENNNIFNPISVEDSDAFRRQCVERSEEEAIGGGLLDGQGQRREPANPDLQRGLREGHLHAGLHVSRRGGRVARVGRAVRAADALESQLPVPRITHG